MNEYRTALRAISGEFISRRLVAFAALLSVAALPLGRFLGAGANSPKTTALIAIITGLTAFSNAAIWARDERLQQVLAWPVSRPTVARSSLLVGTALFVVEFAVPQVVLYTAAGQDYLPALANVAFSILTYATCWSVLLFPWPGTWVALFGLSAALAAVGYFYSPGYASALALIVLAASCGLARTPPLMSAKTTARLSKLPNYFLVSALADQRIWVNAAAVVVFSVGFILLSADNPRALPLAVPLGISLPVTASVLTTMLSRDPATHDVAIMLGRQRQLAWQYWRVMAVYFSVLTAIVALASTAVAPVHYVVFLAIVPVSCAVAGVYLFLELKAPLRSLKTEKEILKHPRRYVVSVGAALLWITLTGLL